MLSAALEQARSSAVSEHCINNSTIRDEHERNRRRIKATSCSKRDMIMRTWAMLAIIVVTVGCSQRDGAVTKETSESPTHQHGPRESDPHEQHGEQREHSEAVAKLVVTTVPAQPRVEEATKLVLQLQKEDGTPVTRFQLLHEKQLHLIVIREGLDLFAHLHPEPDASGKIAVEHRFSKPGIYHLFVDHQPAGGSPSTAVSAVQIMGPSDPATPLIPSISPVTTDGGLKAQVALSEESEGTLIQYRITDADGKEMSDLEPYLGAMGHLVIVSADGREYVHAHPAEEAKSAPDGKVAFVAHFSKPGLYKAWGQFQRMGEVFTVPFVIERTDHSSHSDDKERRQ